MPYIEFIQSRHPIDWRKTALRRDELVASILGIPTDDVRQGSSKIGWICSLPQVRRIEITEEGDTLGQFLNLVVYGEKGQLYNFELGFDYRGDPSRVRLRNIHFGSECQHGLGRSLLAATVRACILNGLTHIETNPRYEGAGFWIRSGASLPIWQEHSRKLILRKALPLLAEIEEGRLILEKRSGKSCKPIACPEPIARWLISSIEQGGARAIESLARTNFYIIDAKGRSRNIAYYLFNGLALEGCVWDLTSPKTRRILKKTRNITF